MHSQNQLWALCLLTFSAPVFAETLNILNWEDYLSPAVIKQWEAQSDSTITEVYFDNDEKRDEILLSSDHHNIDIAVVDEVVANLFGQSGRLLPLDESNVPSLAHIDQFWRDRCGPYAAPYFWGTLGIAYRTDKVSHAPTSWNDLLNPSDAMKGHIGMMDDHTDMLAPALFLAGQSLNTENSAALKEVFEQLKAQAPHVLTYDYAISFIQTDPKADELYMALVYGGDQHVMNELSKDGSLWRYTVPEEGTVLWVDCLAVSSSSQHIEQALAFIDFLQQPEIAAANTLDISFATPNTAAIKLLPKHVRQNPDIFPAMEIIKRSELYTPLSDSNVQLRQRITSAIIQINEAQ